MKEVDARETRNLFKRTFPDAGKYRRELYPQHIEFFKLGHDHNERGLFGGNRSGKTRAGAYEATCHLTGAYPPWWEGRCFLGPTSGWAIGDIAKNARDILQAEMLGPPGSPEGIGTGMLPADTIIRTTPKHGLADAVETVFVRHISGGVSDLQFKSYDQGREAFQGTSKHFIWEDEEPPLEIHTECLLRTLTVDGLVYVTATPLRGLTDFILMFMPELRPPDAEAFS